MMGECDCMCEKEKRDDVVRRVKILVKSSYKADVRPSDRSAGSLFAATRHLIRMRISGRWTSSPDENTTSGGPPVMLLGAEDGTCGVHKLSAWMMLVIVRLVASYA